MMRGDFRVLLLDIGHVLVKLDYEPLTERMRALTGLTSPQLRKIMTDEGLVVKFETGGIKEGEFYEEMCRRAGTRIPWPVFVEIWNSIIGDPILPDEVLASLSRKIRLWAVSNTNKLHFDFISTHFAFLRHFEGFVLSHEIGVAKPDSRVFQNALEKTRALASEVLFVDDQELNLRAAASLGIEGFRFEGPDHFVAQMKARMLLPPD